MISFWFLYIYYTCGLGIVQFLVIVLATFGQGWTLEHLLYGIYTGQHLFVHLGII